MSILILMIVGRYVQFICEIARNTTTKEIIEDKAHFPSGMKNLSAYVHGKGLKFGLYSDAGEKTCQGRPGGLGYEKIDAQTYAAWEYKSSYLQSRLPKIR